MLHRGYSPCRSRQQAQPVRRLGEAVRATPAPLAGERTDAAASCLRNLAYPILWSAQREDYADLARMEDVLRASDLDWTVVRPVRLTNKPVTGKYRTVFGPNVRHGVFISRADVAHYMLRALD